MSELKEGVKDDSEKLAMELVSPFAVMAIAAALTYGKLRYSARNWEKGMAYGRLYGAALRHLLQWWLRQDKDKEQGLSHLGAALFSIQCLAHFEVTGAGTDDRPDYGELPEEVTDMLYHGTIPENIMEKLGREKEDE